MPLTWFARAATGTAFGAATILALGAPAWAATNIDINPGNVPTTAAAVKKECSGNLGGGPYPGKDVWVFNLPGNHRTTGDFTTVVAQFDTNGDGNVDTSVTIEAGSADGDDIVTIGTSKAWVVTPAGWTLVGASATISGKADKFVLTHTCAASTATPNPTPSGSPTPTPTLTPTPTVPPTQSPTPTPTPTPTESASPTPSGNPSESPTSAPPPSVVPTPTLPDTAPVGLPVTGATVGAMVALGLALLSGGAILLVSRRRRRFVA